MKRGGGFSLVEMLVALAIFGILLAGLGLFFASNLNVTQRQIGAADANLSVRLALLRMGEVAAHAHYIYPAGQTVTLTDSATSSSRSFTVGPAAMALLLPAGTTYCDPNGTTQTYCGFLYSVEDRDAYTAYLADNTVGTGKVLVEWRTEGSALGWPRNTLPTAVTTGWGASSARPLADSVVDAAAADPTASSLAAAADLAGSSTPPTYDDRVFTADPTDTSAGDSLIQSVGTRVVVRYGGSRSAQIGRSSFVFSRAIPRGAQPNPD